MTAPDLDRLALFSENMTAWTVYNSSNDEIRRIDPVKHSETVIFRGPVQFDFDCLSGTRARTK